MRATTGLLAVLAAAIKLPAIAAPIDDLSVNPLGVASNCYAGTAGTDAVMFWRANNAVDCQPFSGPGSPCLVRREFPTDFPGGNPISLFGGPFLRASLPGTGDIVAFTEYGFNICFMPSAQDSTEGCFGRDFLGIDPHTISYHPDGSLVAVTRLDPDNSFNPTNDIFIANPNTFATSEIYEVTDFVNLYMIDTVDFLVSGSHLIIDAQNATTGQWAIYAIPRVGPFPAVVAPIPLIPPVAGLIIRNPQLAQTSDDFIVFDALDTTTNTNYVMIANILTGALQTVQAIPGVAFTSYPSYTGDDGLVVYSVPDAGVLTQASLDAQPLAGDRFTPTGASFQFLPNGYIPTIYRRGTWNGTRAQGGCTPPADADGDGVADALDNCSAVPNAAQTDADGDSIGNRCDADFNNDCIVNTIDLGYLKSVFFTPDAEADLNVDGIVNAIDLGLFKSSFFQPPGPSGLPNLCD